MNREQENRKRAQEYLAMFDKMRNEALQSTQGKQFSEYVARFNFRQAMVEISRKAWLASPMMYK